MILKRKKPEIIQLHLKDEHTCLENVLLIEDVAGVAHHAAQTITCYIKYLSINTTFGDQANSVVTIRHFVDKVCETLAFINP